MWLLSLFLACRGRGKIDIQPVVLHFCRIGWNLILFITGLSVTGSMMKLPIVPGTDDIVAVERPFPQRTAHMVADAGDRSERTVLVRQRDRRRAAHDPLQRLPLKLVNISTSVHLASGMTGSFRLQSGKPPSLSRSQLLHECLVVPELPPFSHRGSLPTVDGDRVEIEGFDCRHDALINLVHFLPVS